jgi:hypothetical protein
MQQTSKEASEERVDKSTRLCMSFNDTFTYIAQALKALALVRSQKVEESLLLCDEVLESRPTNDAVLTAMMHVLRGLGRSMLCPRSADNGIQCPVQTRTWS